MDGSILVEYLLIQIASITLVGVQGDYNIFDVP